MLFICFLVYTQKPGQGVEMLMWTYRPMSGCVLQDEPQITGPIYWLLLVQHGETQEDNTDPLSNKKDKDHGQQIQTNVK